MSSLPKNLATLAESNDSPSDDQVQDIKSCLAELEMARSADLARLDALDQQLKAIATEQATIQANINTRQREAASLLALLGIRRLPSEMLQEIFSLVALNPQANWEKPRFPALHASNEGPLLVRRVCHRWKDATDNHKQIWSRVFVKIRQLAITLSPQTLAIIARPLTNWLSLSKDEDVHMTIDFDDIEWTLLPENCSNISAFWALVVRLCGARLASLELLNVPYEPVEGVDEQVIDMPKLQRLTYHASYQQRGSNPIAQRWAKLPTVSPNFKSLILRLPHRIISSHYWDSPPWHTLTELQCTTGEPIFFILENATSLRRLSITEAATSTYRIPRPDQHNVVVSSLEVLDIAQPSQADHWTFFSRGVLEHITLPSLHTLALTLHKAEEFECTVMDGIARLINDSGCTLEHLSFQWGSTASGDETVLSPSPPIANAFLQFLIANGRNIRTLGLGFGSDSMMTREIVGHLTKVLPPGPAGSSVPAFSCPNVTHMTLDNIPSSGKLSILQLASQRLDPASAGVGGDQLNAVKFLSLSFDFQKEVSEKKESDVRFVQTGQRGSRQIKKKGALLTFEDRLEQLGKAHPDRLSLRYNRFLIK
ncbi:hypothetical protein DL96DRAFT_1599587 [Flagelloscypha sp. PMI_526]|nr:hypothetical protein DL96DRAFT_1599587 [Flagelloscypha sp. PMI_526]